MYDISSQLVLKWDRLGPQHEIDMADDLTRLAFDTIGLCAFSYRFNEFYSEHMHLFAEQMGRVLLESGKRAFRLGVVNQVFAWSEQERQEDIHKMHAVADEIIADRKRNPQPENKDLLNTMLSVADPETGEKLSDENIRFNLVTFLIAGHETTSATLCFLYYNWLKNPLTLKKAQQEVDEVVGGSVLNVDHLPKLTYIDASIKETLRLSSPIPTFFVKPKNDTTVGERFKISSNTMVQCNMQGLHTDPAVWGDDAETFRPERMLNGGFASLPPNSWKPFGNGMRACIGRGFAEQEMLMNAALVLQRFQLEFADPSYELDVASTLTIKPRGFKIRVHRRPGKPAFFGVPGGGVVEAERKGINRSPNLDMIKSSRSPITILFGGNTGTCQSFALDLEDKLMCLGFVVTTKPLDAATQNLPTDRPVIVITASFEGNPPDNAKEFVEWLERAQEKDMLNGVQYAVFGVGNSDWPNTYHRIPRLVDSTMARLGASHILEIGVTDVKKDIIGPWEDWSEKLIQALAGPKTRAKGEAPSISVAIRPGELPQILGGKIVNIGTVINNYQLCGTEIGLAKRHMSIRLPEGQTYQAGDYLVVQPRNSEETARRVLRYFSISEHDTMVVQNSKKTFMPTKPVSVMEFLQNAVELGTPITKRQIEVLTTNTIKEHRAALEELKSEEIYPTLLDKRYSIIDVLEEYPSGLSFGTYIDMLQPLTPRQYSISSSPRHSTGSSYQVASITFDVHHSPARSGHGTFNGVASNYLATRCAGDQISCYTRPTSVGFRLPVDPDVPILMMAAGTGIAPMRAFLQERARIAEDGIQELAPAILFFGCRNDPMDFIYKNELRSWEDMGIVVVKLAFSRPSDGSTPQYIQDVIWENRQEVSDLFRRGGRIFVCGSAARLGRSVADVCIRIYLEETGQSDEEAEAWLQSVRTSRYISDVY
ncbi:cytochrome P450 [Aspergillus alliaceus]|uniref:cytochrome P450 n=1 Tax=Petromyces alliaceus TaxID=209559 RepID=UPI0012A722C6|nr:cytochrome P450 [Aspergillus alliaceus]KAB8226940.1 cytochrome P450 [Aspergillus alliaceus]